MYIRLLKARIKLNLKKNVEENEGRKQK
jgi:hypothetical protein